MVAVIGLPQGILYPARSTHRLILNGTLRLYAERAAVAYIAAYNVWQVPQGKYGLVKAMLLNKPHAISKHGLVQQRHHGFWHGAAERTQALPVPARHNNGFHK